MPGVGRRDLKSLHPLPMAAEAVLALGVTCLQGVLPALDVAGKTVLLQLDAVVGQIAGNGRVIVPRPRQQCHEDDDGQGEADGEEVGFLEAELHLLIRIAQQLGDVAHLHFAAQPVLQLDHAGRT